MGNAFPDWAMGALTMTSVAEQHTWCIRLHLQVLPHLIFTVLGVATGIIPILQGEQ